MTPEGWSGGALAVPAARPTTAVSAFVSSPVLVTVGGVASVKVMFSIESVRFPVK